MTRIASSRIVTRETSEVEKGSPLMVRLMPKYLEIWPKGTRGQTVAIPYGAMYERALKLRAEASRKVSRA